MDTIRKFKQQRKRKAKIDPNIFLSEFLGWEVITIFILLSSFFLLYCRCSALRPSSRACQSEYPSDNFELRTLFNLWEGVYPYPLSLILQSDGFLLIISTQPSDNSTKTPGVAKREVEMRRVQCLNLQRQTPFISLTWSVKYTVFE